ncbi:hypothetical protein LTR36_002343 [Oleoguttula mirabilis]|uniref:Uncharacterized protein n=1 Tax=Oleoguttula mirabilis TaxID=1507867 RepID=A0AAV9JMI8_9PEZI|nr:hypothetical protein LTR36_002343 [Oleoguttula mirabilis]
MLSMTGHDEAPARAQDASRPTSRLLNIAPELRNLIYSYVLPTDGQEFRFMYGQHAAIPALLHVNRQLRGEVLGLYYGNTTFELIVHHRCVRILLTWLKSQDSHTRTSLLSNPHVNIRVIIDPLHKDYEKLRPRLGHGGAIEPECKWHFSAESYKQERAPVSAMMQAERARQRFEAKEGERAQLKREGEIAAYFPAKEGEQLRYDMLIKVYVGVMTAARAR